MSRKRNNPARAHAMQEAMSVRPCSADDLAVVSGLGKPAVQHWLRQLRALVPAPIHIGGWGPDCNDRLFVPLYSWGPGTDVARPGPKETAAQRMARLRAGKRGQP